MHERCSTKSVTNKQREKSYGERKSKVPFAAPELALKQNEKKELTFVPRLPCGRTENMAQRESYRKLGSLTPNARKLCEKDVLHLSSPCEEAALDPSQFGIAVCVARVRVAGCATGCAAKTSCAKHVRFVTNSRARLGRKFGASKT
jgi:hypothetical protein